MITKNNLTKDNKNQKQVVLSNQKENINEKTEKENKLFKQIISKFINKYKEHLEILIRLFLFQNEVDKKIKNQNFDLNKQNKETVYLINNDWLEKFKSFFEYQDLEYFLKEKSNIDKINSDSDKVIFQQIINGLSMEYFNKIIQKQIEKHEEIDKTIENIYQENSIIKIGENICDMKFLCNFQFVNHKIIKSLMALHNEYIIDLYYIGNNKLLLRFPETMNNIFCDEIGIINENKIFIPQFILYYKSKIENSLLNKFLIENSDNIFKDNDDSYLKILDKNNFVIGYCFSIEYLKKKKEEESNGNQNMVKDENKIGSSLQNINNLNKESISTNSITNEQKINLYEQLAKINKKKFENFINKQNNNFKDIKDNDEENNKIIKPIIEIILLMNIFEKEIDFKFNESLNTNEYNIKECILLKKEWLDKFKEIYINEEIKKCLIKANLEDIKSNINLICSNINKNEYINLINAAELNITTNDMIHFDANNLSKLDKIDDIYYPKDFSIINKNIFEKLLNLYQIDKANELNKNKNNLIKYIINNGNFIFSYEYNLNRDNNDIFCYNILICGKEKNNNKIIPNIIRCFDDKVDKRDSKFNKYIKTQFSLKKDIFDKYEDGNIHFVSEDIEKIILLQKKMNKKNHHTAMFFNKANTIKLKIPSKKNKKHSLEKQKESNKKNKKEENMKDNYLKRKNEGEDDDLFESGKNEKEYKSEEEREGEGEEYEEGKEGQEEREQGEGEEQGEEEEGKGEQDEEEEGEEFEEEEEVIPEEGIKVKFGDEKNLKGYTNEIEEALTYFDKKEIKALIKYYFFINDLKENIIKSNSKDKQFIQYDCYLISYNWMKEFKQFYLYDELAEIIKKEGKKYEFDKSQKEKFIFENLPKKYIENIIKKRETYNNNIFENLEQIKFSLIKDTSKNTIYPAKFEIISPEIYNLIQQRNKVELDLMIKSYILNSKKIIIKLSGNKLFELLIGDYDFETNKFILEIMLNYSRKEMWNSHFDLLKIKSLNIFLKEKIKQSFIIEGQYKVGDLFIFNSDSYNEIKNENNEEFDKKEKMINPNQNKKIIQFLFDLHYFLNNLKYEINNNNTNNNQFKKCFLIKKELIDIYSNFYGFDCFIKSYETKINQMIYSNNLGRLPQLYKKLIEFYEKKQNNNKDINEINYQFNEKQYLFEVSPNQYINNNFLCFEECFISNTQFEANKNFADFQYTIIDHKIILIFNHNINIGILDENNNTFVPETIIKFEEKKDLNHMIQKMNKHGISLFESYFKTFYDNTNNFIFSLKNKNESNQNNNGPKINNFFNNKPINDNKRIPNELNINTSEIKKQMKLMQEKENQKKRILSLRFVLSLMIDIEKVKRKMIQSLKGNKGEKYYLLNNKFFTQYISIKNMKEIINHLIDNKIIESYMGNESEAQENSYIISEIIQNYTKMIDKICCNNEHLSKLLEKFSLKGEWSYIIKEKEKNKTLIYYYDFILLSQETEKLFLSEFPSNQQNHLDLYNVYLGENKIFLLHFEKNLIEVCHLDNKNTFQPSMFFELNSSSDLKETINLLTTYEFIDYTKYFLMFNDDYISPIFDQNNVRIGRAYRYNEELKDYSKFITQEKKNKNYD